MGRDTSHRQLAEMSVEEFFEKGLASSSDSENDSGAVAAIDVVQRTEKKRSKVKKR